MTTILNKHTPRARKEHTCEYCGQPIIRGTLYYRWAFIHEDLNTVITCKAHIGCDTIAEVYSAWEEWNVDEDSVREGLLGYTEQEVREEYGRHMTEDQMTQVLSLGWHGSDE